MRTRGATARRSRRSTSCRTRRAGTCRTTSRRTPITSANSSRRTPCPPAATTYPEYMKTLEQLAKNAGDPRNLSQQPGPRADNPRRKEAPLPVPAGDIKVLPVQGNLYLLAGAGANVVMQIGDDGVLLVDS